MYTYRKKILLVTGISLVTLGGFAAASWAIINSSKHKPTGDANYSKFMGATAYLGKGQFDINKMSVSTWIQYNMPTRLLVEKTNNGFNLSYYNYKASNLSSIDAIKNPDNDNSMKIADVKIECSSNKFNTTVLSGGKQPVQLAVSNVTFNNNSSINIKNDHVLGSVNGTLNNSSNEYKGTLNGYNISYSATQKTGSTVGTDGKNNKNVKLSISNALVDGNPGIYTWEFSPGNFTTIGENTTPGTGTQNNQKLLDSFDITETNGLTNDKQWVMKSNYKLVNNSNGSIGVKDNSILYTISHTGKKAGGADSVYDGSKWEDYSRFYYEDNAVSNVMIKIPKELGYLGFIMPSDFPKPNTSSK